MTRAVKSAVAWLRMVDMSSKPDNGQDERGPSGRNSESPGQFDPFRPLPAVVAIAAFVGGAIIGYFIYGVFIGLVVTAAEGWVIAALLACWWDREKASGDRRVLRRLIHNPFVWGIPVFSVLLGLLFSFPPSSSPSQRIVVNTAESLVNPAGDPLNEYVCVVNTGDIMVNLVGWELSDAAGARYKFPDYELKPGQSVRIHTGEGANVNSDLYWGRARTVWADSGDTATLTRPDGVIEDRQTYPSRAKGVVQGDCG